MSVVGLQPITLKDATLTVAEDDYSQAISQVIFTPQVRWSWVDELCQSPTPMFEGVAWTVTIGFAQDLTTPDSLTLYLLEHAAQTRTITFVPNKNDGTRAVQAEVMVLPAQIGGVPNQHLTAIVTLPCFEEPIVGDWKEVGGDAVSG
ncbi:hypothetical protein [Georgenia sp. H159]|uniref:hypothetical protein n=1 Tax=Georgenia sp. H159 TaxID=3076115 RepID=UPI002D79CEBF|nr:hypothetical protein [Georgenia sp. H159]